VKGFKPKLLEDIQRNTTSALVRLSESEPQEKYSHYRVSTRRQTELSTKAQRNPTAVAVGANNQHALYRTSFYLAISKSRHKQRACPLTWNNRETSIKFDTSILHNNIICSVTSHDKHW
jgi:hypothetical protein